MCNLSSVIENTALEEGIEKGITKGIDLGKLDAAIMYYKRGRISLDEAAADLNLSVAEFTEKMNQLQTATV